MHKWWQNIFYSLKKAPISLKPYQFVNMSVFGSFSCLQSAFSYHQHISILFSCVPFILQWKIFMFWSGLSAFSQKRICISLWQVSHFISTQKMFRSHPCSWLNVSRTRCKQNLNVTDVSGALETKYFSLNASVFSSHLVLPQWKSNLLSSLHFSVSCFPPLVFRSVVQQHIEACSGGGKMLLLVSVRLQDGLHGKISPAFHPHSFPPSLTRKIFSPFSCILSVCFCGLWAHF